MKRIEVSPLQLEAILDGSRLMVVKVDEDVVKTYDNRIVWETQSEHHDWEYDEPIEIFLKAYDYFKQGDEIYIGEDHFYKNNFATVEYKAGNKPSHVEIPIWIPASQMSYSDSRLRFTVGEVAVKRADDITIDDAKKSTNLYYREVLSINANDWLKAQDIEAADYVALVELLDKE